MKYLGIDPGMTRLGFGAIEVVDGTPVLLSYGMIAHPRNPHHTFNEHLNFGIHQIADDFPRLIDLVQPTKICAEIVQVGRLGSNTELVVAAITTVKIIAYQFGIEWIDFGANTIKKETTGDGRATKTKVRNAVVNHFPEIGMHHTEMKKKQKAKGEKVEGLPPDVFDAVAISLTGAKKLA